MDLLPKSVNVRSERDTVAETTAVAAGPGATIISMEAVETVGAVAAAAVGLAETPVNLPALNLLSHCNSRNVR